MLKGLLFESGNAKEPYGLFSNIFGGFQSVWLCFPLGPTCYKLAGKHEKLEICMKKPTFLAWAFLLKGSMGVIYRVINK